MADPNIKAAMAIIGAATAPAAIRRVLRERGAAMHPWPYPADQFALSGGDTNADRGSELARASALIDRAYDRLMQNPTYVQTDEECQP